GGIEPGALVRRDRLAVGAGGHVVGPRGEGDGGADGGAALAVDGHRAAAVLPRVAVGAVVEPASVEIVGAVHAGEAVADAGGEEEAARREAPPVVEPDAEAAVAERLGLAGFLGDHLDAVAREVVASEGEEVGGGGAVAGEEAVEGARRAVARLARVEDEDGAAAAAEDEGGAEPGRASADDDHVEIGHASLSEARGTRFPGTRRRGAFV